jgi:hypothetical protein
LTQHFAGWFSSTLRLIDGGRQVALKFHSLLKLSGQTVKEVEDGECTWRHAKYFGESFVLVVGGGFYDGLLWWRVFVLQQWQQLCLSF